MSRQTADSMRATIISRIAESLEAGLGPSTSGKAWTADPDGLG